MVVFNKNINFDIKVKLIALAKMAGTFAGFYLIFALLSFPIQWIFSREFRNSDIWGIIGQGIFAAVAVGYHFLVLRVFGRRGKPKSGLAFRKNWLPGYLTGVGLGVVCMMILWGAALLSGGFTVRFNILSAENAGLILIYLAVFIMVGVQEEVLTRGTMFYMGHTGGHAFTAVTISVIFAVVHPWGDMNVFSVLNLFLWSLCAFLLVLLRGDLWLAMGFHFSWNAVMGCVLGVPVSGRNVGGVLLSEYGVENYINGGAYGLEGSFLCTILLGILLAILFYLLRSGKIRNKSEVSWLKRSPPALPDPPGV
jgi:membrane protease YdiL (CAAX protease family)